MMSALVLSCALIGLGLYGALSRRELVAVLASLEVMLGGATLLLVAYGAAAPEPSASQAIALLVLTVGAAEAAVGLALVVALVRRGRTRTDEIREVRG
jgi:NADH-quinone oxidoreductase subunit K/NAD(P)H-quinone oxidoreductase subunit 4L